MKDGELSEKDGRYELRFVRELSHPIEKVWEAVTSPAGLSAWFPFDVVGERRTGAALSFVFREGEGDPFEGSMVEFTPPLGDGARLGGRRAAAAGARAGWGRRVRPDAHQPLRRDRQGGPRRGRLARLPGRAGGVAGGRLDRCRACLGRGAPGLRRRASAPRRRRSDRPPGEYATSDGFLGLRPSNPSLGAELRSPGGPARRSCRCRCPPCRPRRRAGCCGRRPRGPRGR